VKGTSSHTSSLISDVSPLFLPAHFRSLPDSHISMNHATNMPCVAPTDLVAAFSPQKKSLLRKLLRLKPKWPEMMTMNVMMEKTRPMIWLSTLTHRLSHQSTSPRSLLTSHTIPIPRSQTHPCTCASTAAAVCHSVISRPQGYPCESCEYTSPPSDSISTRLDHQHPKCDLFRSMLATSLMTV